MDPGQVKVTQEQSYIIETNTNLQIAGSFLHSI